MNYESAAQICMLLANSIPSQKDMFVGTDLEIKLNYVRNNFPESTYKVAVIIAKAATGSQVVSDYLDTILKDIENG